VEGGIVSIAEAPWTLEIPAETPSLNTWQRMHWRERARVKGKWVLYVRKAAFLGNVFRVGATVRQGKLYGVQHGQIERRRVTVTSYRHQICDYDRFVGGLVPLIDALVNAQVIVDDAPKWLEHGPHRQVVDRKNRRTVVVIEPVDVEKEQADA